MELTYTQVGDYLLPNLVMDPQPEGNVGVWGRRRKRYLKERRGIAKFTGVASVDGHEVCSAELMCAKRRG